MSKIEDIIHKLQDGAESVIDLPDKHNEEHRYNAAFVGLEPPHFQLVFPPKSWESDSLLMGVNCQLTVKHKHNTVNLIAELDSVASDRRLNFIGREPIKPEELREYFRVAINTSIEIGYTAGASEVKLRSWKMIGTTVDLSGSGVLGLFAEKPASNSRLYIQIGIPQSEDMLSWIGHVVRTYRMRRNRYQVALHFDDITPKKRDQIIACCLQEQRRQLRERVQTE
ncbi:PilZ domain-containing protein [Desulfogranum mediterraneum]|uniref:PilZ domain-containing protein n=1 Tax=Desulfogranum mediterraneum TaxID=160661 RepID=UPI0004242FC0|nr:PilZ domain-containing protein [Desulfogranum mediterraneum]